MDYKEFIQSKKETAIIAGFNVDNEMFNPYLFPFQRHIVKRALQVGRFAIFADCGLGKTLMQLAWAEQVARHTGKPVLILAPLAVSGQTCEEGAKFKIQVSKLGTNNQPTTEIINYEQLKNIDASIYSGIVLDESSILKNFNGSMRNLIIESFKDTPYKLACTATPSPNDPMELGNHSEFLGSMSRVQMLAMYFVHDGGQTSKWRLKRHSVKRFYQWVNTWAVMISSPEDLGYDGSNYSLPKLNIHEHLVKTEKTNNGKLFNDVAVSATNYNAELRRTMDERLKIAANIANGTDQPVICWVKQNEESKRLTKMIPGAVEVVGSDKPEDKERKLLGFAKGDFRVLVTKTKIAQFGLNYQHCSTQIFVSVDFSFESTYQGIRRSYRFGQKNDVDIHLIATDTMQNVIKTFNDKQQKHLKMQHEMTNQMKEFNQPVKKQLESEIVQNERFTLMRGDCCELIQGLESESVGFSIFSPPFADLYTYSSHVEDMGNSSDYNQFVEHFKYLTKELYRVMKSGRNVVIHCMDLPIQKGKEGFIGLRDFSGMIIDAMQGISTELILKHKQLNQMLNDEKEGRKRKTIIKFLTDEINSISDEMDNDRKFIYHSRVTIWKNPVTEMQRTKALGLLHKQLKKDSTMSRVGIPDYLLIFRKDGERKDPVKTNIPVDLWQKWASPVWMDIDYGKTLNYRAGRDEKDEKHICPLQLPTIERSLGLYSNPGDLVLSPFAGIGSEGYQSLSMNRRFIGFELKESYFEQAVKNCKAACAKSLQQSLF